MTTFTLLAPNTKAALLTDLEELWQRFDELVGTLGPDDWSSKHGKHWTFTDVPYHLAYFDLEVIVTAIKRGLNVPTASCFCVPRPSRMPRMKSSSHSAQLLRPQSSAWS